MFFKKNDKIDMIISEFVMSNQFDNFKAILEDAALNKFSAMQNAKTETHPEMLANKAILNFYMNFAQLLEYQVKTKAELDQKKKDKETL